jgi:hypothetical protein
MKETELAKNFVEYLSCYDLYYEVECSSGRIDIVALNGSIRMAFEVKTNFNFKVLEQAINNLPYFHYSYIAVPYFRGGHIQDKICRDYGIGLLTCNAYEWMSGNVEERVKGKLNRHPDNKFSRIVLTEANKKNIPGMSGSEGGRMTPFRQTVENLVKYIEYHKGCSLKEAIENINHHYTSFAGAKSTIYNWIRSEVITEVELIDEKLYLKS